MFTNKGVLVDNGLVEVFSFNSTFWSFQRYNTWFLDTLHIFQLFRQMLVLLLLKNVSFTLKDIISALRMIIRQLSQASRFSVLSIICRQIFYWIHIFEINKFFAFLLKIWCKKVFVYVLNFFLKIWKKCGRSNFEHFLGKIRNFWKFAFFSNNFLFFLIFLT